MLIGRGADCVPPRRLRRRTISCSPSPSSASRSGAGEDWLAQAAGRKTNSSVRLLSAASCSRRSVLLWTSGSQATTAPTPSAASERSQTQAASRPGALATSRRDKSIPDSCSAGACSGCGEAHKRARQVRRSTVAPALAVADSVRQCPDARAGFRSSRHAASRRRAARGQVRQSPSAHRVRVFWPAYRRARHRAIKNLRKRQR
jgi:hypothetical protein